MHTGAHWCTHWGPLGPIGAHWGPWVHTGAHWCTLGHTLVHTLGHTLVHTLGPMGAHTGAHWGPLGHTLVHTGAHWCSARPSKLSLLAQACSASREPHLHAKLSQRLLVIVSADFLRERGIRAAYGDLLVDRFDLIGARFDTRAQGLVRGSARGPGQLHGQEGMLNGGEEGMLCVSGLQRHTHLLRITCLLLASCKNTLHSILPLPLSCRWHMRSDRTEQHHSHQPLMAMGTMQVSVSRLCSCGSHSSCTDRRPLRAWHALAMHRA